MEKLDEEYYDAILAELRNRQQVSEEAIFRWTRGDQDLMKGLVFEIHVGGQDVWRVFAGPYWAEGQAGAGPVVLQLPCSCFRRKEHDGV